MSHVIVGTGRRPSSIDRTARTVAIALALSTALIGCYQAPTLDEEANDIECQIQSQSEATPGYPFDLKLFDESVLPMLKASCGAAGCHAAPVGTGNFTVWNDAAQGNCNYAKSFNSLASFADLANPQNSAAFIAISGALPAHPVRFEAGAAPFDTLLAYLEDASVRYLEGGGGGVTPPPGASPFDYAVYQSTIQPILDSPGGAASCASAGCHAGAGQLGFALIANPAADSDDMEANFIEVTSAMNLTTPASSLVYLKATTSHAAGASATISPDQAAAMLAWIEAAKAVAGDNPINCTDAAKFDVAVFRDEILPILRGDVDLNNREAGNAIGCTRGVCHAVDRGPASLILKDDATAEDNLQNFACFVNLTSASSSQVLLCPTDDPGCNKYPHPGEEILTGADDLNYQRILAYLFAAKTDSAPLDFAFFARRINPIFSDNNVSDPNAGGLSCADAVQCHGVAVAGQLPANGSNFGLLANASDKNRLNLNFLAAASFANFLSPEESSLFLYPTNEIANVQDHPLATGIPHPGGEAFAPDSDIARDIIAWARGLRPDADGFQKNWLITGAFPATRITDPTAVPEATVTPQLFDLSGGQSFAGEWEGLFEDERDVDLQAAFGGAPGSGRVIYAVAYLLNSGSRDIAAQLTIDSPNAVKVYVDGTAVVQTDGGPASFLTSLPSFRSDPRVVRLVIKVLQRADDEEFRFSLLMRDDLGRILDEDSGVIVKLGPQGGI